MNRSIVLKNLILFFAISVLHQFYTLNLSNKAEKGLSQQYRADFRVMTDKINENHVGELEC